MQKNILITGSIAYDVIFDIPEDFRRSIPLEGGEIRNFNASYTASNRNEYEGGTAGNISFWLGDLGASSTVFSAWGQDFYKNGYREKLEKMGVQFRGHEGEFTAHAYIISDPLHQQLTIWQPNDYQHIEIASLKDSFAIEEISNFKIAIFSAGTPLSIKRHLFEFKNLNPEAFCIFDPGQVAQFFNEDDMRACADLADMIVGNNIEFNYLRHLEEVQKNIQIETCGSRGALFRRDGEEVLFPAQIVDQVKNTTGAGDAFRAGMIHEIVNGARIEEAIEKGIELGAKCVQFNSAQYF